MDDPFLTALVTAPGPPGFEDEVRRLLRSALGDRVVEDTIGNLLLRVGTGHPRVVFCAHMDTVGLLAVGLDDDGAVRFRPLGRVDEAILPGRHVRILTPRGLVPGVIGIAPPHLREGGGTGAGWRDLAIDIGATDRREAEALGVRPPLPAAFAADFFEMQEHWVGRGVGDRLCCYLLVRLARRLQADPPRASVTLAWTAQNEVGMRGARALAARREHDVAVHLAAFGTTEEVSPDPPTSYVQVGQGPVIRARAGDALASPQAVAWVERAAAAADIRLQLGFTAGESEATLFQETGAIGISLNLAVRYLHTDVEIVARQDVVALERLLEQLVDHLHQIPGRSDGIDDHSDC